MLEKENQCLKSEIENQQVVIEMLITNDECAGGIFGRVAYWLANCGYQRFQVRM